MAFVLHLFTEASRNHFTHAGDDMTGIFATFHTSTSYRMMKKFYIGDLIPETREHKDLKRLDFEDDIVNSE